MARVLVLGGGFGGLTAATSLARRLGGAHEVTLVDRRETFLMGLAKLWVLDGRRRPGEGARRLRDVERLGVRFLQGEVESIDLRAKSARVAGRALGWDFLVVALGAELRPSLVPGLDAAHDLYSADGVAAFHRELAAFRGGKVLVLVASMPFKCPPAPYEAAMLAEAYLRSRGVPAEVAVASPEPHPLPLAGPACGAVLRDWVEERGIRVESGRVVREVDGRRRVVRFADGHEEPFDLLAAVPPHVAPRVLRDAGLAAEGSFVPADARTLATRHADVFAVGDANVVKLANGKALVKAGVMAEGEAAVVAANLAARIAGEAESARFDGRGSCFVELGGGLASEITGDFYHQPDPLVSAGHPSADALAAKHAFERDRLAAWFGT